MIAFTRTPQKIIRLTIVVILMVFAVLLQQACRKTEINRTPALHEADFVTKFFTTNGNESAVVLQIIAKLKAQNERTNFVNKLPRNCGLPVWNKLILHQRTSADKQFDYQSTAHGPSADFDDTGDSTVADVILPLTISNSSLSSVLIAFTTPTGDYTIDCRTTNAYLYQECHIAPVNKAQAENDLVLFFFMESRTFGNTKFYDIPANLFPEITAPVASGKETVTIDPVNVATYDPLSVLAITAKSTVNGVTSHVTIAGDAVLNLVSIHFPLPPICINENTGDTVDCYYDPIPGGGGSGGGGGNGGGGTGGGGSTGGGGTGGGGGNTGGGGGGNGCPWYNPTCAPPPPPPAPATLNPCQVIDSAVNMPDYKTFLNQLKLGTTTERHETAIVMLDPLTNGSPFGAVTGPEDSLAVDFDPPVPIGGVLHNHYQDPNRLSIFSFDDIQKLYDLTIDNKIKDFKTFTFGVVTDISSYILMIDSTTFKNFGDVWLSNPTSLAAFNHVFYDGYNINSNSSAADNELRFLKALQGFNLGIKIFRGNNDLTQFVPITLNANATAVINDPSCALLSYNQ